MSQEAVDGSVIAAHAATCCSGRLQRAQPGEQLWVHGGENMARRIWGHGDVPGSGRDGLGSGLEAQPNHISQSSKGTTPRVHTQVWDRPGDEEFHAEQVKQGEISAGDNQNIQVLLPTLVLQHERGE